MPNYAQFIDQSKSPPREIAEIMVKSLHFAYGVEETYSFEIGPKLDVAGDLMSELGIVNG